MSQALIDLAVKEIGVKEWKDGENPVILAYFKDAGHPQIVDDETAWCAAFVGAMLKRLGLKPTGSLLARSYLNYGTPVEYKDVLPGDIFIKPRGNSTWQGHVAIVLRKKGAFVECVGGNQKNQVSIATYNASSALGFRRPPAPPKPAKVSKKQVAVSAAAGAATVAAVSMWDRIQAFFSSLF